MAATHTDRTELLFAGRIDQSLNGASNAAVSALGRIQAAGAKATTALSSGFQRAGENAVALNRRVGLSVASVAAWGGAVALAMAAWREASKFVSESMEAANDERALLTARKLTVSLENIPFLAKRGAGAIKEQAAAISEAASRMEKFSGTSEAIFKSSFSTLVSFGATKDEVNAIAKPMADWLALTKGTAASMEDANDLAEKIGEAVDSKKIGRWAKQLGLTPEQQKQWKSLTSNFERLNFLGAAMEKRSRGQAASQVGSLGGQLLLAKNEEQRILAQYGGVFKKIELTWKLAVVNMEKALLPLAGPAIDNVRKSFETVERVIGEIGAKLQTPQMTGIWKDWQTEILKVQTELKPLSEWFGKNFSESAIVDFFSKELPNDCANALAAFKQIEELCRRIGADWNEILEDARKIAEYFGATSQVKPGIAPEATIRGGAAKADPNPLFKSSRQIAEEARAGEKQKKEDQDKRADKLLRSKFGDFPITGAGGGQNWGTVKSGAYDDAFREASKAYGIPFNTLKGLALQENVDPRDNNPLGRSNDAGAYHYTKSQAMEMIMRQASLSFMKGFRQDATPEERAKAYRIYTPVGAPNDRGQNQFKQRETDKIIRDLDKQSSSGGSRSRSGHTTLHSNPVINIHGSADKNVLAQIKDYMHNNSRDLLKALDSANDHDYSSSFV